MSPSEQSTGHQVRAGESIMGKQSVQSGSIVAGANTGQRPSAT